MGDSRGHQGQALAAPKGRHGTALGVPKTLGRHTSTHTWAPRHMRRAPRGHNDTRPGANYLIPALAWEHLKDSCTEPIRDAMGAMPWLSGALNMRPTQTHDAYAWHRGTIPRARGYNSHGRNAMAQCCESVAWWETEATGKIDSAWHGQGNSEPWLTEETITCPRPLAPWHDMSPSINVGNAHWCTKHTWSADESMLLIWRAWSKAPWWAPIQRKHLTRRRHLVK